MSVISPDAAWLHSLDTHHPYPGLVIEVNYAGGEFAARANEIYKVTDREIQAVLAVDIAYPKLNRVSVSLWHFPKGEAVQEWLEVSLHTKIYKHILRHIGNRR